MEPYFFDPFMNRRARDIRNDLSHAFLRALAETNTAIFQRCGAEYLQQQLAPVFTNYVKVRLAKFTQAYASIAQFSSPGILQQAAIFWDLELYYEMHELLEHEWKEAEGSRRRALQGLIRAAGMKIHAENRNVKTAAKMGLKALADLEDHGGRLEGFTRLEAVLGEIKRTLRAAGSISGLD